MSNLKRTGQNYQPIQEFSEDFAYDPIGKGTTLATYNENGTARTSTIRILDVIHATYFVDAIVSIASQRHKGGDICRLKVIRHISPREVGADVLGGPPQADDP